MLLDLTPYNQPLSRTPTVLRVVLEGRSDDWLDSRHDPDVLSPRETAAHLLLCECEESWITRLRRILEPDLVVPGGPYEGVEDAELANSRSLESVLDEFEVWRVRSLEELVALKLTNDDLTRARTGKRPCTFGELLNTWVAHDLYHLGQIFKSFSSCYVGKIGPYQEFLNLPYFN